MGDLNDGKHLYTLDHGNTINALTFSPNRYWLCAGTGPTIKIWDLESKNMVEELRPEVPGTARADPPPCLSLAWSADGQTLFAGYSDNLIRVWQVSVAGTRQWPSYQEVSSSAAPQKKSTVASKLSWLCRWSARCTVRSKQHVHIIVLLVYCVHMQLCLNPVAAI